jgi:hypothetical protein
MSYFAVLGEDDDDSSASDNHEEASSNPPARADIPAFEDLSVSRADELTVLEAVYGADFTILGRQSASQQRHSGKQTKTEREGRVTVVIQIRPPDIDPSRIGCRLKYVLVNLLLK